VRRPTGETGHLVSAHGRTPIVRDLLLGRGDPHVLQDHGRSEDVHDILIRWEWTGCLPVRDVHKLENCGPSAISKFLDKP
jgi:hypothetical protein